MASRGHAVEVVTNMANYIYDHDGVSVIGNPGQIRRHVRHADVVVSHLGDDGRAHRAAVDAGTPSVRMVHGAAPDISDLLTGASLAVFNAQWVARCGWDGNSVVVHPPVDPDEHRTDPGQKVTLVNLAPEKGSELLGLLAASMPDTEFLGVRGGYGRQRVRTSPNLEVIGTTSDMRRDVWSRTRVLLMPSRQETWGRVGVEAMASGIPVIAHPCDGLLESLGDAGIFVDRSDLSGWVRELTRLHDPDEWSEASHKALQRSAQLDHRADLDRFCDALEALVGIPA